MFCLHDDNLPIAYQLRCGDESVLAVNQTFCDLLGYRPDEISDEKFGRFLHPGWLERFQESFCQGKAPNQFKKAKLELVKRDGSSFPISCNGAVVFEDLERLGQTRCVLQDAKLQRCAEKDMLRRVRCLETLVELGAMQRSREQQALQYVLDQAVELTESEFGLIQVTEGELKLSSISRNAARVCKEPTAGHPFLNISGMGCEAIKTSLPLILNDFTNEQPCGGISPPANHPPIRSLLAAPLIHGESDGALLMLANKTGGYDETDSRQALELLRGLARRRCMNREAEKLLRDKHQAEEASHSKSNFLAAMSHEIRTPLNGLLSMVQLIRLTGASGEQAEYLDAALEAGKTLTGVINEVLDLAKIEAGRMDLSITQVDLDEFLEQSFNFLRKQADRKGLELWWRRAPAVPERILTDAVRLRQILHNLVSNAVKFTHQGFVAVNLDAREPQNDHPTVSLVFTVTDTGRGIPEELADKLFEPFVQAKADYQANREGSGLGLAIVHRLLRLFGGDIQVESELGRGSTFRFTLPASIPPQKAAEESSLRCAPDRLKGKSIMVVDGDLASRESACGVLKRWGINSVPAKNGQDALRILGERKLHCVLLNIQMSDMSGLEVLRRIRDGAAGQGETPPVLGVTDHVPHQQKLEFLKAGMDACLDKPLDDQGLLLALCEHVKT
jgi:signal transduction histidine kinase/ActR/RegA family two-component response regulator